MFVCVMLFTVVGCEWQEDDRLQIVVTVFPVYDWVMNVVGERSEDVNVTLLLDSSLDMHSYQPSFDDEVAIMKADLFLYVGGESDKWVPALMKGKDYRDVRTMDLLSLLGDNAREEETVEDMQEESEDHDHDEDEETEYDEHVWLSLRNAARYVDLIAKELGEIDAENADIYAQNAADYIVGLNALDATFSEIVEGSPRKQLLFADRFPFLYFVKDYGLEYSAAFKGCSSAIDASFAKKQELIDRAKAWDLKVILKLENSSLSKFAESIREESGAEKVLVFDSLQSASKKEYAKGRTYLAVMQKNAEVLREALAA